ncbi:MAG: YceD family protein [Rhodobacterales bacterium]
MAQPDPKTAQGTGDFRVANLKSRAPPQFSLRPDAAERDAIARELGIEGVRKLIFEGQIAPLGKRGWRLSATLGATVVQACVVTLAPVVTRIDEEITRTFVPPEQIRQPDEGSEIEMPEDDTTEPLGDVISARASMIESLALALPMYPRAEGAELGEAVFTEDGTEPIRDADLKPFAGLAGLRDKMDKED